MSEHPSTPFVRSATREVVIGSDQPFCLIGERLNPTGRKIFAEQLRRGDLSRIAVDVEQQVAGGATMLDVNMGVPLADEAELLAKAVTMVQELTDLPLCIDSSVVEALEAGLAAYQGKALVNSITGERERMDQILPIVKRLRGGGDRPAQRGGRDPGRAGAPAGDHQEDPRHRGRRVRDPAGGHRHRPAGDADRGGHLAGQHHAADHRADPRRARPEHDPRRLQRLVRHARTARAGRGVPADGDACRPDQRDHGRRGRRRSSRRSRPRTCCSATTTGAPRGSRGPGPPRPPRRPQRKRRPDGDRRPGPALVRSACARTLRAGPGRASASTPTGAGRPRGAGTRRGHPVRRRELERHRRRLHLRRARHVQEVPDAGRRGRRPGVAAGPARVQSRTSCARAGAWPAARGPSRTCGWRCRRWSPGRRRRRSASAGR